MVVHAEGEETDIIFIAQSPPSEDGLAVYDVHLWREQNYLWRVMASNRLYQGETPLVNKPQQAFARASKKE